jgi:hypothetical protein
VGKLSCCRFVPIGAGPGVRSKLLWAAATLAFCDCGLAHADVYKCVGADGAPTYTDNACDSRAEPSAAGATADPTSALSAARGVPVVPAESAVPVSSFDRKIHELLLLTQLSGRESPGVEEVAHSLVARIDLNLSATPQDPRWAPLSRAIQADIRADMPQLGRAFVDANQALVRALGSQMKEADADAMLAFLRSPTGVSYLQFLGDSRAVYASAMRSVLGHVAAQTPISQSGASPDVARMRLRLVTLATGATGLFRAQDAAHNVNDPSPYAADGILPQQVAAVTGPGLDDIAARYETALVDFETFSGSPPARNFFSIVVRPVAAKTAATEAAMKAFGDAELEKYGTRWKVAYQRGIYYVAVIPGADLPGASGPVPRIQRASYVSPQTGRAFDVTHVLQSACARGSGSCKVACGNQLAGDPDFGHVKYCQIAFQCGARSTQNVSLTEGRSVTLACAP